MTTSPKDTHMRAVWWCDPGVSNGVAWGIFNLRSRDVTEAFQNAFSVGSETINVMGYDTAAMQLAARQLYTSWRRFKIEAVRTHFMYKEQIVCGMEDFVLYPVVHTPGIEGIFPAYVIGAFEGYRLAHFDRYHPNPEFKHYTPLSRQGASVASRHNNQDTLKPAGVWIRGREHERMAFAHIWAYLKANII